MIFRDDNPAFSAVCKLQRARNCIESLRGDVQSFLRKSGSNTQRVDLYPKSGNRVVKVTLESPPVEWAAQIGEIIHNLRSSLDHLVWQLVIHDSGKEGDIHTTFPICVKRQHFESSRGQKLRGLLPASVACVDAMQPYHAGENGRDPNHEPLAVLHKLWNIDKHRTIHLCASGAQVTENKVTVGSLPPDGMIRAIGPVKNGEILSITPSHVTEGELVIEAEISFQVMLNEGAALDLPYSELGGLLTRLEVETSASAQNLYRLFGLPES